MQYTSVDLKVLELLGENSAVVSGLPVKESGTQFMSLLLNNEDDDTTIPKSDVDQSLISLDSIQPTCTSSTNSAKFVSNTPVAHCKSNSVTDCKKILFDLKKRNLELDIEIKEIKKRKLALEVEQLERQTYL